jgi:hypothetical protein
MATISHYGGGEFIQQKQAILLQTSVNGVRLQVVIRLKENQTPSLRPRA